MEVYGRENGRGVFLWLVSNIKVLVTASYVMGKCRTGVFVSVFCNARESMELPYNKGCLHDSAVSLYFLEIPHFTLVEEQKVFKNNVKDIYSASPTLCIFFCIKAKCILQWKNSNARIGGFLLSENISKWIQNRQKIASYVEGAASTHSGTTFNSTV
jgi:hypothetical protein